MSPPVAGSQSTPRERGGAVPMPFRVEGCVVSPLGPGDAPALQDLYERCTDFHQIIEGKPTRPTAAAEEIAELPAGVSPADKLIFGVRASAGEPLMGVVDLLRDFPAPRTWWFGLLMLDPAVRGAGLGSRICRAALEWAAARGARTVLLGVVEENIAAERFWRRHGFRETHRQPYTSVTGHRCRVIVMRRRLLDPNPGGAA